MDSLLRAGQTQQGPGQLMVDNHRHFDRFAAATRHHNLPRQIGKPQTANFGLRSYQWTRLGCKTVKNNILDCVGHDFWHIIISAIEECLYLSVLPIAFSRITLKKFRRLFKNEVNVKICPKITSFNFSLDIWYLKPNFPSVFHSQVIGQEKCFPSGKFMAILVTQRKLQVTRKG